MVPYSLIPCWSVRQAWVQAPICFTKYLDLYVGSALVSVPYGGASFLGCRSMCRTQKETLVWRTSLVVYRQDLGSEGLAYKETPGSQRHNRSEARGGLRLALKAVAKIYFQASPELHDEKRACS